MLIAIARRIKNDNNGNCKIVANIVYKSPRTDNWYDETFGRCNEKKHNYSMKQNGVIVTVSHDRKLIADKINFMFETQLTAEDIIII